jgi:hypothetical protein
MKNIDVVHKYRNYLSSGSLREYRLIGLAYCGEETVFYRPLTALDMLREPNCELCLADYALDKLAGVE